MSEPRSTTASSSRSKKASAETKPASGDTSYAFLNFSHPAEAKEQKARRTVRSHVTRQQHQKEHLAAAADRRSNSMNQPKHSVTEQFTIGGRAHAASYPLVPPDLRVLADRQSPASVASSPAASTSPSSPCTPRASLDPYQMYPHQWIPYINIICDTYVTSMSHDILNTQDQFTTEAFQTLWMPFVFTDAALMHATLLVGACFMGSPPRSQPHDIDVLQLRGMTISAINESLQDSAWSCSDHMIAAVLSLAHYEAFWGGTEEFKLHMQAVRNMVAVRGGLAAFSASMHGLLERMVLAIDYHTSRRTGSSTSFNSAFDSSNAHATITDPKSSFMVFHEPAH